MSPSSRKTRKQNAPDAAARQPRPESGEARPPVQARPRLPNRPLLAASALLYGVWLVLLLLLALHA